MAKFRKLFAALIGVGALVAMRHFDVHIPGVDAVVIDLVVSALTAFGVYAVPNEST